jgi:putative chitinase
MSACWWWKKNGLNEMADKDMLTAITKRINGGKNGLQDRLKYLGRAKWVIK